MQFQIHLSFSLINRNPIGHFYCKSELRKHPVAAADRLQQIVCSRSVSLWWTAHRLQVTVCHAAPSSTTLVCFPQRLPHYLCQFFQSAHYWDGWQWQFNPRWMAAIFVFLLWPLACILWQSQHTLSDHHCRQGSKWSLRSYLNFCRNRDKTSWLVALFLYKWLFSFNRHIFFSFFFSFC